MTDYINRCKGDACTVRDSCYRFIKEEGDYIPAYQMAVPLKDKGCMFYWDIEKDKRRKI